MRLLVSLTAITVFTLLLGTCSAPPTLVEQIQTLGQLRVVTRNSPTTFYLGADEPLGPEYELAQGFADELGVELQIYPAERFWQILPEVASGQAHIGAAGLTITEPRKQLVQFGPVYQRVDANMIYRIGSGKPADFTELFGKRIEVLADSSHAGILRRAVPLHPSLTWVENAEASEEELIARVAAGNIDYTIADENVFNIIRHLYPDARVAFKVGQSTRLAWALPRDADDSLRERVASYFARLTATGKLDEILNRYYARYGHDFDYVGSRAFVRHIDNRLPAYREWFMAAAEATDVDWQLLAAMAYQESHWDPEAVSPTGVKGIMMLTNRTASMVGVTDRVDPLQSIQGGARYFARVMRKIPARIAERDRLWLAVAAYNVGYGHLEDARILTQAQGGNPDDWYDVRERLPLLSQKKYYERTKYGYARGWEPVYYVDNVRRYVDVLRWMTAADNLRAQHVEAPQSLTALN